MLKVERAKKEDNNEILNIYSIARLYMKKHNNPNQWSDYYPALVDIIKDEENDSLFVIKNEGKIVGVFTFFIGEEPTYLHIEEGEWKGKVSYGVLHRLSSSGEVKGIGKAAINYAKSKINTLRIDTHHLNLTMQNLLLSNGFKRRGIIYVENNTPRIAYEWIKEE